MRRICWTIVYLVALGLPVAGAAEPKLAAEEPQWKGAAPAAAAVPAPPRVLPSADFYQPVRDFLARWQNLSTVQRPAWPTLNPNAVSKTVYPVSSPVPDRTISAARKNDR